MAAHPKSAASDLEALRDRLEAAGADALDTPELLAFVLRRGAGLAAFGWAERLLAEFGSLPELLGAPRAALRRAAPDAVARDIEVLHSLQLRTLRAPLRARLAIQDRDVLSAYLRIALAGERREQTRVLFLDKANRLLAVHLTLRALGDDGSRLNPKKADLQVWRERFAEALRGHGVAAEATPRRTRGVTRKAERGPLLRMRQRHAAGVGTLGRVQAAKLRDAARTTLEGAGPPQPWEVRILRRQQQIRALYLAQAKVLKASPEEADRRLGAEVEAFVRGMPAPDTERLALARAMRAARQRGPPDRDRAR